MASAATPAIQNFLMRTSIGKRPLKDERASLPNQLTVWTGIPILPRCNLAWLKHPERARQPQRDLRHVGDDAEEDQHGQKPRPHRDRQFGDAHLGDAGSDIEVEPDRWVA